MTAADALRPERCEVLALAAIIAVAVLALAGTVNVALQAHRGAPAPPPRTMLRDAAHGT